MSAWAWRQVGKRQPGLVAESILSSFPLNHNVLVLPDFKQLLCWYFIVWEANLFLFL